MEKSNIEERCYIMKVMQRSLEGEEEGGKSFLISNHFFSFRRDFFFCFSKYGENVMKRTNFYHYDRIKDPNCNILNLRDQK